jgi:hypothetical protein
VNTALRDTLLLVLLLGTACSSAEEGGVMLSEMMSNNGGSHLDEDGDPSDWIEIENTSSVDVSIQGWGLTDDERDPFKWVLPYAVIPPGGQLLIYASDKDRRNPTRPLHTNFKLKSSGEVLLLTSADGRLIDRLSLPPSSPDISWGRQGGDPNSLVHFHRPSPGTPNATDGWVHPLEVPADHPLQISEFLVSDGRTQVDEDGDASDWVELINRSDDPIDLIGYALSDNAARPTKWRLPSVSLPPQALLLIYASGKDRRPEKGGQLHTNFRLNGLDDVLVLTDPQGRAIDGVSTSGVQPGISVGRPGADPGLWLSYPTPTPGMPNTTRGFDMNLKHTQVYPTGLQFSEVVAQHARSSLGDRPDWVELVNRSEAEVQLGGIGLSDEAGRPFKWRFPRGEMAPGEIRVLELVGAACGPQPCPEGQVPLSLSPGGERLMLTHPSGRVLDVFHTGRLQPGLSSGRRAETGAQRLFFTRPSRGAPNDGPAFIGYTDPPIILSQGGPSPGPVRVRFAPPVAGTVIRTTTNGGIPHQGSSIYTQPILLTRAKTLRARAFRSDRLPSPTVTRTFLIGKQHPLVTLALTVKDRYMFELKEGLYMDGESASTKYPHKGANYWREKELAAHLELYEPGGQLGLDMPIGLKIFGAYSRGLPKKSLQLIAREVYGQGRIRYPLFADKGLTDVHRIVLRQSGQDAFKSHIRDVLMSSLVADSGVDYQGHRLAVLYINARYWGLYNIREKIHTDFLADNHSVSPGSVDLLVANGRAQHGDAEDYAQLIHVAKTRGFAETETYGWVGTQMDLQNYADYQFFQLFFANSDNGNIRFWRSSESDGRWRWILYDLDTGFSQVDHLSLAHITHPQGTGAKRRFSTILLRALLDNPEFKDLFLRRAAHHLRHTFEPSRVRHRINALAAAIAPEIRAENARWLVRGGRFEEEIALMQRFAQDRPERVRQQLVQYFDLSAEQAADYGLVGPETLP